MASLAVSQAKSAHRKEFWNPVSMLSVCRALLLQGYISWILHHFPTPFAVFLFSSPTLAYQYFWGSSVNH